MLTTFASGHGGQAQFHGTDPRDIKALYGWAEAPMFASVYGIRHARSLGD